MAFAIDMSSSYYEENFFKEKYPFELCDSLSF